MYWPTYIHAFLPTFTQRSEKIKFAKQNVLKSYFLEHNITIVETRFCILSTICQDAHSLKPLPRLPRAPYLCNTRQASFCRISHHSTCPCPCLSWCRSPHSLHRFAYCLVRREPSSWLPRSEASGCLSRSTAYWPFWFRSSSKLVNNWTRSSGI